MKLLQLLTEAVNQNSIIEAINNRYVVRIYYLGDEGKTNLKKGYRTIEVVALGISKAGNVVFRAWQRSGVTNYTNGPEISELPGFRLFRLDRTTYFETLMGAKNTPLTFNAPRPKFNPNNDRSMTSVIAIAKFNNNPPSAPQTPPNTPPEPVNPPPKPQTGKQPINQPQQPIKPMPQQPIPPQKPIPPKSPVPPQKPKI